MPQKRRKPGKRRQVGMSIGHHTHLGAGRPVEHPGWNLQPTIGIGTAQRATENNSRPPSRSPRERQPKDQTTDAIGTAVPETQFRGCSQASLYNTKRPHSSIGYRTPAAYANHLTATGHRAALHEGSARCPVAHTAPKGVSTAEAPIATWMKLQWQVTISADSLQRYIQAHFTLAPT